MMKRILACLVVVACLLPAFALADGDPVDMRVIKVNTRVNIREYPGTEYAIVGKAPLGAELRGCQQSSKNPDWYAVIYEGVSGYIRSDFLEPIPVEVAPAEAPVEEPLPDMPSDAVPEYDPSLEPAPVDEPLMEEQLLPVDEPAAVEEPAPVEEPTPAEEPAPVEEPAPAEEPAEDLYAAVSSDAVAEYDPAEEWSKLPVVEGAPIANITDASGYDDDQVVLMADVGPMHIVGRRIYQENREYMAVAALDADSNQLWMRETATGMIGELTMTDAFIGGTAQRPLVMLYNSELGMYALDAYTGEVCWLMSKDDVSLGASVSHALSGMGVLYIGGYYGPDPVAIDASGVVLWQSYAGSDDIYGLNNIELRTDGIACSYSFVNSDGISGTVIYSYDGVVTEVVNE